MEKIINGMRLLNEDHTPDGWPAVKMSEINELLIFIEKQAERIAELERKLLQYQDDYFEGGDV
jgi:DNA-directed RNA polymerase specialized sigma54-like protein